MPHRARIPHVILEREDCIASLWHKKSYDCLHLHLAKQFCQLPHLPHLPTCPTFMSKNQFITYIDDYVAHFKLCPHLRCTVESALFDDEEGKWQVVARNLETGEVEEYVASFVVVATGENDKAVVPEFPGTETFPGEIIHSMVYRNGSKAITMATSASIEPGSSSAKKPRTGSLNEAQIKWRTGAQERIYNRRLIEALSSARAATTPGPHAVKEAADSALAITARGQSRWSRAILTSRLRRRKLLVKAGGRIRRRRRPRPPQKQDPAAVKGGRVGERLRALGRLVPGCRRLPAPTLLEEAADYVAALQMQVKTMRALADALSAATITSPAPETEGES